MAKMTQYLDTSMSFKIQFFFSRNLYTKIVIIYLNFISSLKMYKIEIILDTLLE